MKIHLNFLPQSYRRKMMLRTRLVQWGAVWVIAGLAAAAMGSLDYREYQSVDDELAKYQRIYAPTEQLMQELTHMRARLEEIEAQEEVALVLENRQPGLTLLGAISDAAHACNGFLQVKEMKLRSDGERQVVELSLETLDQRYRRSFIEGLRTSGLFIEVKITGDTLPITIDDIPAFSFKLTCEY